MSGQAAKHTILGGKVHVYRRENSGQWQCSTYLAGRNHRVSTKTDSLAQAKDFAEDWYLSLRGKNAAGELKVEKTFKHAAKVFEDEYEVITEGQRSPAYVRGHKDRIRLHLTPYFGSMALPAITASAVQGYRVHRMKHPLRQKPTRDDDGKTIVEPWRPTRPSKSTLHHELVTLRQVLKTAQRHGWLTHLPDMTAPYRSAVKVSHRAWFTPEEYRTLYRATRARSQDKKNHRRKAWEQLHDYVLFMANTGLRPDEAALLECRDVKVIDDVDSGERILEISVRGKRGTGYCKSTRGAVRPFERIVERLDAAAQAKTKKDPTDERDASKGHKATDRLFPTRQSKLLGEVLTALGLKEDREGRARTAYSLRHTYISMRLLEGADIYQVAKNCRTSVEMIQKFYAAHISSSLNAAAINVRRPATATSAGSNSSFG